MLDKKCFGLKKISSKNNLFNLIFMDDSIYKASLINRRFLE